MFRGVFAVAAAPATWKQKLKAACLAGGSQAHVYGRGAARLWQLKGFHQEVVEICVVGKGKPLAGVICHRTTTDVTGVVTHKGFRVRNPAATLLDLCALVPKRQLEEAMDDALRRGIVTLDRLELVLAQEGGKGRRGVGLFRQLVEERREGITHSELERWMRRLLKEARLPPPKRQWEIFDVKGEFVAQVDLAYPDSMLVIELDGYGPHSQKRVFEKDRVRSNALTNLGWRVLHFTWERLRADPEGVIAEMARALGMEPFPG